MDISGISTKNSLMNTGALLFGTLAVLLLAGCATESQRTIAPQAVASRDIPYHGVKANLAIGNFENRSSYAQGIFSSQVDRLGNQAKTILKTHLQQTNRFKVVDRDNLKNISREAEIAGVSQNLKGARYVVTGDVTEFGRKVTGDRQLFGILGSGKTQSAYAKVSLNIVDVISSEIVHSVQGAGEFALDNRQVLGFGGTSGYDATLNGKVLNLAIQEAVNILVQNLQDGLWVMEEAKTLNKLNSSIQDLRNSRDSQSESTTIEGI